MDRLNILWTTDNKETIENMLTMYTTNAMKSGWWDQINIVIWGASTKLVGEDPEVQKMVKKMLASGVTIEECKACADKYKLSGAIKELGVTVKYMTAFTGYIKGDDKLLTI
jgi:hypothetical protein